MNKINTLICRANGGVPSGHDINELNKRTHFGAGNSISRFFIGKIDKLAHSETRSSIYYSFIDAFMSYGEKNIGFDSETDNWGNCKSQKILFN